MRLAILLAIACAAPLAAQRPTQASDSATIHALAVRASPEPANARVVALVVQGDTAKVTLFTIIGQRFTAKQHLRYVRRPDGWTFLLPDPLPQPDGPRVKRLVGDGADSFSGDFNHRVPRPRLLAPDEEARRATARRPVR